MSIRGIGIDIIEIKRFRAYRKDRRAAFLQRVFTRSEMNYCFSFKDPAPHLAGTFAAKEAVVKATGGKVGILGIEIRHDANGKPEVYIKNEPVKSILVSISHTTTIACATAISHRNIKTQRNLDEMF